ncbi:SDR family oxidoreductase [Geovibrio thiophilus]|uniref:SDR family oxidoreductase n=1 Tax=Geovibrio thiophilus TaxID=139438 RepID=A0A410K1L6_9BACT|nr:SDR family oxidoreductase [Geovibrio thiophilus]QAR34299.1 SDR family oxidoreductase [Geovibrio thiophilus]
MKTAIITGGSRGLGKNMALALADKGTDLIITYQSRQAEAEETVRRATEKGRKAAALQLNVSDNKTFPAFAEEVKEVLKDFGRTGFDILVNNAGMGINTPFTETTEEQFDLLMNTHFKGTFFLTQKLLPLMNDNGRIMNISTGLTRFSMPGYSAYASMKGAVEVLTRYLAKELGHRGISAVSFAPGAIETDFGGGHVRDNNEINARIASITALGRVGLPDDIGGAVAALLSDECRWINGQRIEASGGMLL